MLLFFTLLKLKHPSNLKSLALLHDVTTFYRFDNTLTQEGRRGEGSKAAKSQVAKPRKARPNETSPLALEPWEVRS